MFTNILDPHRQNILPLFSRLSSPFYLAGGTALALQIGHRDSIDFDFFTEQDFSPSELFEECLKKFHPHSLLLVQNEKNTLTFLVDNAIKVSFFSFPYPLVKPLISTEFFPMASLLDTACMKCSAIVGRATQKDYVDMYFLLHAFSLAVIFEALTKKMPALDQNIVLKSLHYFEDIEEEEILFFQKNILWDEVKTFLQKTVEQYALPKCNLEKSV